MSCSTYSSFHQFSSSNFIEENLSMLFCHGSLRFVCFIFLLARCFVFCSLVEENSLMRTIDFFFSHHLTRCRALNVIFSVLEDKCCDALFSISICLCFSKKCIRSRERVKMVGGVDRHCMNKWSSRLLEKAILWLLVRIPMTLHNNDVEHMQCAAPPLIMKRTSSIVKCMVIACSREIAEKWARGKRFINKNCARSTAPKPIYWRRQCLITIIYESFYSIRNGCASSSTENGANFWLHTHISFAEITSIYIARPARRSRLTRKMLIVLCESQAATATIQLMIAAERKTETRTEREKLQSLKYNARKICSKSVPHSHTRMVRAHTRKTHNNYALANTMAVCCTVARWTGYARYKWTFQFAVTVSRSCHIHWHKYVQGDLEVNANAAEANKRKKRREKCDDDDDDDDDGADGAEK